MRDMTALVTKRHLLEKSGYVYSFDRMIYFNRSTRKVFSVEFVEDNNEENLQSSISENTGGGEWQFYFTSPPSESVKRELKGLLG